MPTRIGAGAYRGPERRTPPPPPPSLLMTFAVGGIVLLAVVLATAFLRSQDVDLPEDRLERILDMARATTMMSAAAAFTAALIRWQQSAELPVALIGTGALVFGGGVVGTAALLLPIIKADDLDDPLIAANRAAALLVVFVLLAGVLVMPPVDTRLTPLRVGAGAVVVVTVVTVVLARFPGVAEALSFGESRTSRMTLGGVWTVLALVLCYLGLRRGRGLLAWTGLMLFALALSELTSLAADGPTDLWSLGSILIETLAMVFVIVGLAGELQRSYLDTRARLFDTQIAMQTVEARALLGGESSGRRRHDLGNAMMALQGAARTLEREHDRLSEDNRKRMADMLGSSVQRLHRLVGEDPTAPGAFSVLETAESALSTLRTAGLELHFDVPDDLRVYGVRTAATEALRRIADTVWTEKPRGAVDVIGAEVDSEVWLSVVFEPSAPRAMRMLTRLRRDNSDHALGLWGEGSTLTVAARLIEDTGGRLSADPDGENRLAFRLALPAAPPE